MDTHCSAERHIAAEFYGALQGDTHGHAHPTPEQEPHGMGRNTSDNRCFPQPGQKEIR